MRIAAAIEGLQHFGRKPARLVENRINQIAGDLRTVGHGGDIRQSDQFLHHKLHVPQGCGVGRHGFSP